MAARTLIEVSGWERERLSERTQKGLEAARLEGRRRGRRAVADDPELRDRIAAMRAEGMTLQSIADRLNQDGVPTVRGGAMWRPSSVQAAAGYKRRPRARLGSASGRKRPVREGAIAPSARKTESERPPSRRARGRVPFTQVPDLRTRGQRNESRSSSQGRPRSHA